MKFGFVLADHKLPSHAPHLLLDSFQLSLGVVVRDLIRLTFQDMLGPPAGNSHAVRQEPQGVRSHGYARLLFQEIGQPAQRPSGKGTPLLRRRSQRRLPQESQMLSVQFRGPTKTLHSRH